MIVRRSCLGLELVVACGRTAIRRVLRWRRQWWCPCLGCQRGRVELQASGLAGVLAGRRLGGDMDDGILARVSGDPGRAACSAGEGSGVVAAFGLRSSGANSRTGDGSPGFTARTCCPSMPIPRQVGLLVSGGEFGDHGPPLALVHVTGPPPSSAKLGSQMWSQFAQTRTTPGR